MKQDNTIPYSKEHPESSMIERTSYDPEIQELTVTFRNGKSYVYQHFEHSKWERLLTAPSIGKFINTEVKSIHPVK